MDERIVSSCAPLKLSAKATRTGEAPISPLMAAAVGNPDLINFAAGLVDDLTLPVEECAAITKRIFAEPRRGQAALQYDTTLGLRALRQQLLAHIESLEGKPLSALSVGLDDVIVTTGSQQMLYLVADVLVDPGDIVIAPNPSYFVFTHALKSLAANVLPVPMDEQGMDVDAVAALLRQLADDGRLDRTRFIYVPSYYDNPTGLTLSLQRRGQLVDLVRRFSREHRILILEDAAYRELHYDGPALPSIKSFDPDNRFVILTQTFSKPFSPGLKLGYTLVPRDLMPHLVHQKSNHDFGSASLCQHIALEAMRDGSYQRHVAMLRGEYRRKRDAMVESLARHMPRRPDLHWMRPHGGLYVWLMLPAGVDSSMDSRMFAACRSHGVLYVPGDLCFTPDERGTIPRNHARLNFGQVALDRIDAGVKRLAGVVAEELASAQPVLAGGVRA